MIKDPWPCYYRPMLSEYGKGIRHEERTKGRVPCRYMRRFNLMCYANKFNLCNTCYMYQQDARTSQVKHICDRCGFEVSGADDKLTYLGLQNRDGGYIAANVELCEACATQLLTWLGNKDFFEDFYGNNEEP